MLYDIIFLEYLNLCNDSGWFWNSDLVQDGKGRWSYGVGKVFVTDCSECNEGYSTQAAATILQLEKVHADASSVQRAACNRAISNGKCKFEDGKCQNIA